MSLGALAFLNPWLLGALASLPLIYWLLRTVPPRPRQVAFPPTRILEDIENREKTPAKTPWWLLLIRLLAAALVILALADPVLNPQQTATLKGKGPVILAIDNGWASGANWSDLRAAADRVISDAEAEGRSIVVLPTAAATKAPVVHLEAPADARATAAAIQPEPFAPDRMAALNALKKELASETGEGISAVWITDGIDHKGSAAEFASGLATLANDGVFTVLSEAGAKTPLGVLGHVSPEGKLAARVMRAEGAPREGTVLAFSARAQRLGEQPFKLGDGETQKELTFELPLELRNQVTRIEIAGEQSSGAVSLLDSRSQWQRVGLISGAAQEQAQPLLAPLYYIEKAIKPFAEVLHPKDQNIVHAIKEVLKGQATVVVLADIGTLQGEVLEQIENWVKKGGVLVRFAGPRLEKGGDSLLPSPLRIGGRTLGGALSWSTPQPLAPFEEQSVFAGLAVPSDVTVKRQVLADPTQLGPATKIWARLKDGTPLVTAAPRGAGQIILFHVTANTDWSNLPISGLFVEMLRRVTTLGGAVAIDTGEGGQMANNAEGAADAAAENDVLAPQQTLDGFGMLRPPPPTAQSIPATNFADVEASLDHPPGYYGAGGTPRAMNVLTEKSALAPLPPLPGGTERRGFENTSAVPLKPWLLALALGLIFADIVAVILLQTGARIRIGRKSAAAATIALLSALVAVPDTPRAQTPDDYELITPDIFRNLRRPQLPRRNEPQRVYTGPDAVAQTATARVTLGYVLTGDATVDNTSKLGLSGLSRVLAVRTAVEPGDPMAVDIDKDEIAFFPVLYWPVLPDAKPLSDETLAKIDAFMKQGGMIIFDTRDYSSGVPEGLALGGRSGPALQRLIGKLDLPRLEPVPKDHVLTRSFYLLRAFPGRWDGGELWVEANEDTTGDERKARRADGVSSILITSNDFAAAWALDESGRPVYPVVPGGEEQREYSLRSGINIVMHALTGNYKADQVHVPALLERLGQ